MNKRRDLEEAGKRKLKPLQRVFNPTVAQYKVATGQPYGHKVQKRSLGDTKSTTEKVKGHKATSWIGGGT